MLHKKTSVIMPVYNTPRPLLWAAIRSVVGQLGWSDHGGEDQLIIVNDGSDRPETLEAIDDAKCAWRSVTVVKHQERMGQAVARNTGVAHSRAKWIAFLDADDTWFSTSLYSRIHHAVEGKANFLWSSFIVRTVSKANLEVSLSKPVRDFGCGNCPFPRSREEALVNAHVRNFTKPLAVVMTRALFCAAGGFEPYAAYHDDWLLWRRCLQLNECVASWLDEPVGYYNTFDDITGLNQGRVRWLHPVNGFELAFEAKGNEAGQLTDRAARDRAREMMINYTLGEVVAC